MTIEYKGTVFAFAGLIRNCFIDVASCLEMRWYTSTASKLVKQFLVNTHLSS